MVLVRFGDVMGTLGYRWGGKVLCLQCGKLGKVESEMASLR